MLMNMLMCSLLPTFQDEERWPIDYGKASASLVRHGSPLTLASTLTLTLALAPTLTATANPHRNANPTPTLTLTLALPRCAMASLWA